MHYFVGLIFLVVLGYLLPAQVTAIFIGFLILAALIVKVSAKVVTKTNPPLLSCVKAVIYSAIFAAIAGAIGLKVLVYMPLAAIVIIPVLIVLSQAMAYSTTLSLSLGGGLAISIFISLLGWALSHAFGISSLLTVNAST